MKHLIFSAGAAALVVACASPPQRNDMLEQAGASVEALSSEPMALQAAHDDLDQARASLNQAEAAFQAKRPTPEVNQLAYLAIRHAQAGEARIAEARARQQIAQAQDARQQILLDARERQAAQAQQQASRERASAAAAQDRLASARQELKDLQAKQTDRGLVMTLNDVLFDTDKATLKPGAQRDIDRLAQALKDNPDTRVRIEGYTDSTGSDSYNMELSQRRAQAVADALQVRGVPADRYQSEGLGEGYPIAPNDTAAGRQENRRVEIVFSDDSGRFAQAGGARGGLR